MSDSNPVTEFTIERERWYRGKGPDTSRLQISEGTVHGWKSNDGKRCCLGFFAIALGIPERAIKSVGALSDSELRGTYATVLPSWLFEINEAAEGGDRPDTTEEARLMETNDSRCMDETEREDRIVKIFANHGVKVVFK